MRSIHAKNTKPENIIQNILNILEIPFEPQCLKFYGKPDFVCEEYKAAILVNGCFWHSHNCHMFRPPNSSSEYWTKKLHNNTERDKRVLINLNKHGYKVLIIWECALMGKKKLNPTNLQANLEEWLLVNNNSCEIDYQGIKLLD